MATDLSVNTVTQQSILNKSKLDKFLLVLTLPSILKGVNNSNQNSRVTSLLSLDSLQYSVHGTLVPDSGIEAIELPFSGQTAKFTSYTRTSYKPVTVNFAIDNQFNNWWVLWYWLNVINDSQQSAYNVQGLKPSDSFSGIDTYKTNISVFGLDGYNNPVIQWDYTHAFITNLAGFSYSYQNPDQIESSFTFAFGQLNAQLLAPPVGT